MNQIEWLDYVKKKSNKKSVKKIAVENFLITVGNNKTEYNAIQNLWADAKSYKWNSSTIDTIYKGIKVYFNEVKPNMSDGVFFEIPANGFQL